MKRMKLRLNLIAALALAALTLTNRPHATYALGTNWQPGDLISAINHTSDTLAAVQSTATPFSAVSFVSVTSILPGNSIAAYQIAVAQHAAGISSLASALVATPAYTACLTNVGICSTTVGSLAAAAGIVAPDHTLVAGIVAPDHTLTVFYDLSTPIATN